MGESDYPTTADYAYSNASDALQRERWLERRVAVLEMKVAKIDALLRALAPPGY